MKVKKLIYYGVAYLVPEEFEFIDREICNYPSFCGAGKGIGDKIVPEFIGGLRISHICHGHDESFDAANYTFVDFIISNMMFAYNLLVYLSSKSGTRFSRYWRGIKGSIYVLAVCTIGWKVFKDLKEDEA